VTAAEGSYDTQIANPTQATPSPPVHAARLANVLKSLASAEGAVAEGIRARTSLIEALEKLLADNRTALSKDEATRASLAIKMTEVEGKKKEVEDGIMRGLSDAGSANHVTEGGRLEPARPEVERLTPPPPAVETLTPVGSPGPAAESNGGGVEEHPPVPQPLPQPGADLLSSLTMHAGAPAASRRRSSGDGGGAGPGKRPRLGDVDDASKVFGDGNAMDELDDDVAAMLGK
jgi:regulator of Ty1 transposition protein 103